MWTTRGENTDPEDLKNFIKEAIRGLKTEIAEKIDSSEASLKGEISKIGEQVTVLRQDHEQLREAHEKLANNHKDLETDHLLLKGIVSKQQVMEPVAECIREMSERAARQKNAIVFGVPEVGELSENNSNAPNDVKLIRMLLSFLSSDLASITFNTNRIGNHNNNSSNSSARRLKVCLPSSPNSDLFKQWFIQQKKA